MKRTWIVYITMGAGHELNNCITEAQWYGPFTKATALKLESKLNKALDDPKDDEHAVASAMPLESLSPREIIRKSKAELIGD